ncbi:MAG: hypothetical protein JO041_11680 [Acidobacteria bacterium]|nr:hypothetical protein [Acidobacteriota bacterium]
MASTRLGRVGIVGAATLKGRELAEVLAEVPTADVKLLDDEESLGQLEAVGDEMSFVQAASREQFSNLDVVFFASDARFTRKTWQYARAAGALIVDLSYALADQPGAQIRCAWLDSELGHRMPFMAAQPVQVVAHPAAMVMALLLARLGRKTQIEMAVANVLEPASEQGRRGLDELHQQTVNLLSFQEMPKAVFDSQLAFNVLPRYGKGSAHNIELTERRVLEHYRAITRVGSGITAAVQHNLLPGDEPPDSIMIGIVEAGSAPDAGSRRVVPSLAVYQAPIFHAHAVSLFVELRRELTLEEAAQALQGEHIAVMNEGDEPPTNVSAAGQGEIQLAIRHDGARRDALWLWAAADNLKIMALNAVASAAAAAAMAPKGRIQ